MAFQFHPCILVPFDMGGTHDIRAQAVAQAVFEAIQPDLVILFGSRARGDYRPDSDIDLLILSSEPDRKFHDKASCAAFSTMRTLFDPEVNVEFLTMTSQRFHTARVAPNHVAGQACRDGVTMDGAHPPFPPVGQPNDWPDIEQRFTAAWRNLRDLDLNIEAGSSQELVGFLAQQTVENVLKGWISVLGAPYRNLHDIADLANVIRQHPSEVDTNAGESLTWLTKYAVTYRYEGARVEMESRADLLEAVTHLCNAIWTRAVVLTGREDVPRPLDASS